MGRIAYWLITVFSLLLLGCGPVSVQQPGDDDDDDNNVTPPPTNSGTFTVSSSNPNVDLNLGEIGIVDITITPVDGYTGTVDLSAKTVANNVDVSFEDAGVDISSITLDGTNPVTINALVHTYSEVLGNVFFTAPYSGQYTIDFSDGANTGEVQVNAAVSNYLVYSFLPANSADSAEPYLPHSDNDGDVDMTFYVGAIPVFMATGSTQHEIHTGGFFTHMSGTGGNFMGGATWSPVLNRIVDLSDPVDIADLEANGVVDQETAPNFYCHNHGSGSHEGTTRVDVIAMP